MCGEGIGEKPLSVCNSCNDISKEIMGCNAFIPAHATKQMDTQIVDGMIALTS